MGKAYCVSILWFIAMLCAGCFPVSGQGTNWNNLSLHEQMKISVTKGPLSRDPRFDGTGDISLLLGNVPQPFVFSGSVSAISPNGSRYASTFNQNECVVRGIAGVIKRYKNGERVYGGQTYTTMFHLEDPAVGAWRFKIRLVFEGQEYTYDRDRENRGSGIAEAFYPRQGQ